MTTIERDLTTPDGVSAEMKRIAAIIGPDCNLSLHMWTYCGVPSISVSIGMNDRIGECGGSTFAEMLDKAEVVVRAYGPAMANKVIRKMALAIIEITDEHTECTRTLLRG